MEARISVFSSLAQHIGDQVLTRRRCRRSAPVTIPRPRPLQNRCFELELHARAACLTFACFGRPALASCDAQPTPPNAFARSLQAMILPHLTSYNRIQFRRWELSCFEQHENGASQTVELLPEPGNCDVGHLAASFPRRTVLYRRIAFPDECIKLGFDFVCHILCGLPRTEDCHTGKCAALNNIA